jgi:hypothetical protein
LILDYLTQCKQDSCIRKIKELLNTTSEAHLIRNYGENKRRILSATANASAREVQHAGCFAFYPRRKLLVEESGSLSIELIAQKEQASFPSSCSHKGKIFLRVLTQAITCSTVSASRSI